MKKALIFANGSLPSEKLVYSETENCDVIICADGGANRIINLNIKPDYIIGDLDSVLPETIELFSDAETITVPDQSNTDLEKAVNLCLEREIDTAVILGATGGRLDQFLGNISVLTIFKNQINLVIKDDLTTIMPVNVHLNITGIPGQVVSLFPLGECNGITTKGLKYSLENESLSPGTRGISNEFYNEEAEVEVQIGDMIVIINSPERTNPGRT